MFLDNAWNDDGVELSLVLPTDFYSEIGGGCSAATISRSAGRRTASTRAPHGRGLAATSAAIRRGAPAPTCSTGKASGRGGGGAHAHEEEDEHGHEEEEHEDEDDHFDPAAFFSDGAFTGDTRLWSADVRFTWAPTETRARAS